MHWSKPIVLVALLLGLTGCAETAARAIADGTYLQIAAGNYVRDVHAFRKWIRDQCQASLVREIDGIRKTGTEADLRALLEANYPKLVTMDILEAVKDDFDGMLSVPPGCKSAKAPE